MNTPRFSIAAVERDIGLSKDVLRVWERRYGFPAPERDAHGERLYPLEQVERLRVIKRLMDQGHRPARLIATPVAELAALSLPAVQAVSSPDSIEVEVLEALLAPIKQHDAAAYTQGLLQCLARQGLQHFVVDTIAPLTRSVGLAWEHGRFEVFEEHLFTELTKRVLRQAIAGVPGGRTPRVLLTSPPEEPHALGLLMAEAMLALDGAHCIPLGTQMPLLDIAHAARAHRADVVALSFSAAFAARQVPLLLQQLRELLPPPVQVWAGGAGLRHGVALPGVRAIGGLHDVATALAEWRAAPD